MRIVLVQSEITEALEQFVGQHVNLPVGTELEIDLKATRGDEGYQAFIDITFGSDQGPKDAQPSDGATNLGITDKVIAAKTQALGGKVSGKNSLLKPTNSALDPDNLRRLADNIELVAKLGMDDGKEEKSTADVTSVEVTETAHEIDEPADEPVQESVEQSDDNSDGDSDDKGIEDDYRLATGDADPAVNDGDDAPTPTEPVDEATQDTDEVVTDPAPEAEPEAQPEPEPAPAAEPKKKTKSLFANLTKPTNG